MDTNKDKVKAGKKSEKTSTQSHLRIAEIKNDTVILRNGGIRAVLETTSINFNLKSEPEQNAIIQGYQSFLNTLDFPIQIVVKSKKLDLDNYLASLTTVAEKQTNALLQKQTYDYIEYIKRLLEYADIMSKSFYVVIPYESFSSNTSGLFSMFTKFLQRLKGKDSESDFLRRKKEFDQLKKGLEHRVNQAIAGLENCGLKVERLNTSRLVELYYNSYNPETSRTQKFSEVNELDLV